jgi:hypothetical protein
VFSWASKERPSPSIHEKLINFRTELHQMHGAFMSRFGVQDAASDRSDHNGICVMQCRQAISL